MRPSPRFLLATVSLASVFAGTFAVAALGQPAPTPTPPPCTCEKMKEIRAPASMETQAAEVDCNLTIESNDAITKRLLLSGRRASGVTVNCNWGTLKGADGSERWDEGQDSVLVRSKRHVDPSTNRPYWERPEDVTIRNCIIVGSARIAGMGTDDLRMSSRLDADHPSRARDAAPTRIVFDQVKITGVNRNPLYFQMGVTASRLINSEMDGRSSNVAIYLDAESSGNEIRGNYIHVRTGREVLAVDGSERNKIVNNRFSGLNHGGIYLYRNCGERGVVRHSTPSFNQIINNVFYYRHYTGPNPSVYLGSRDRHRNYCGDDSGEPFGSSADDRDFARHNAVLQNQIFKRRLVDMILTGHRARDSRNFPNYIAHNDERVATAVERRAGCFVQDSYDNLVPDGGSIDVFEVDGTCRQQTCSDGMLLPSAVACDSVKVAFDCQVAADNAGCRKSVACPDGRKVVGARAACDLEFGSVSEDDVRSGASNILRVVRPSDVVASGSCFVHESTVREEEVAIIGIEGLRSVLVGCKEYDRNGGDCHIRGNLYCK